MMVGAIQNSVLAGTTKEAWELPKSPPIIKYKVTKEYEDKGVNSLLVWTSQRVYMVVPLSEKYPLIRKNPLLFFAFVLNWNEGRIEEIELETLLKNKGFLNSQRRTSGASALDSFVRVDQIEGFTLAGLILDKRIDKFELAGKKREIIEELKTAYSEYRKEYERYLKDTFTFVSCGSAASSSHPLPGNDGSVVWRNRPPVIHSGEYQGYFNLSPCRQVVESSDYSIDSEMLTKPLIDAYGKELGQLDYNVWLKVYFSYRHRGRIQAHPKWSKWQNAHIPLENAKTLFLGGGKAREEILLTVKPVEGWIMGHTDLTSFKILKIEKHFYSVDGDSPIFKTAIYCRPCEVAKKITTLLYKSGDRRLIDQAIVSIGAEAIEPLLAIALNDDNPTISAIAAGALGGMHDDRAIEPLIELIRDGKIFRPAALALLNYNNKQTLDLLVDALKTGDERMRIGVISTMGILQNNNPTVASLIVPSLKDSAKNVRRLAAGILGESRNPIAVEPLAAVLLDEDDEVRSAATWALGKLGDKRVAELPKDEKDAVLHGVMIVMLDFGIDLPDKNEIEGLGKKVIFGMEDPSDPSSAGKGQCSMCHSFLPEHKANRGPSLIGIIKKASERIKDPTYSKNGGRAKTPFEYLAESNVCPSCFVVDGYALKGSNGKNSSMPAIHKPPMSLSVGELIAIDTYLFSRDGSEVPTVSQIRSAYLKFIEFEKGLK